MSLLLFGLATGHLSSGEWVECARLMPPPQRRHNVQFHRSAAPGVTDLAICSDTDWYVLTAAEIEHDGAFVKSDRPERGTRRGH
jgi:hypothetical protein